MSWLKDLFQNLVDALAKFPAMVLELLKDIIFFIFDLFMMVVDSILVGAISILQPIDISQYMGNFPPEAAWMLSQIGLPQALTMIVTAISVRLLLQLIPGTRLGS